MQSSMFPLFNEIWSIRVSMLPLMLGKRPFWKLHSEGPFWRVPVSGKSRLALQRLAAIGVPRALLTCNAANVASARVIEKCGAVRVDDSHQQHRVTRRYWLETTHS